MEGFFTAEDLGRFAAAEDKRFGEGAKVFNALYVNAPRLGIVKHCDKLADDCGRVVYGRTDLCEDGVHEIEVQSFLEWEIVPYHHARGQLPRLGWESIYLLQKFQIELLRRRHATLATKAG